MSSSTETFISRLASYYRRENDLSNISVALCNSCWDFKRLFVKFFFKNLNAKDIISIAREVPDTNSGLSRVDIMIEAKSNDNSMPIDRYLIEVKVGDKSQHFNQYVTDYCIQPDHLGYIVNYDWRERGFTVKKWRDIYNYLKKSLPSVKDEESISLIEGYLSYVKSVCGIIEITNAMDLTNIKDVSNFFRVAAGVLSSIDSDSYHVKATKIVNPTSDVRMAPFTYLQFDIIFEDGRRTDITGYLYLFHGNEEPIISIGFEAYRYSRIAKAIDGGEIYKNGRTFVVRDVDTDGWYGWNLLWFDIKNYEVFASMEKYEAQEKALYKYVKEVIDRVCTV